MADVNEFLAAAAPGISDHLRDYLATDGADGYLKDLTILGASKVTTHLVLRTIGRRTGRISLAPLIYMPWRDEFVIVASRGGSEEHPGWFHNLTARSEVDFQVRERKFRGTWRLAEADERRVLWDYSVIYYPPYAEYQAKTGRTIPVIVLTAKERIEVTWALPEGELPGAPVIRRNR